MMISPSETISGGCDCRLVRYAMVSTPLFVHCCHCRWCQRETGSAFVMNALIESDRVQLLSGEVDLVLTPSASGKGQKIARCPRCRIAIWSHYAGAGDRFTFIRVGTLDEPDRFPPDIHIFTESKQRWVILPDNAPVMLKYYDREKYWPKESLERRAALLANQPALGVRAQPK
ncbi:MAG TPA: GFA family protein [Rhodanobacteraceae bacterium]|nr:GFA family protein [Rhodanobacteraceae bacterium]